MDLLKGIKFDMSKVDMSELEADASHDLSLLKDLGEGLPTHEEINGNTVIKYDGPMLTLQGRQVVSVANGFLIIAPQKTGKSQVCEAIAASVVITDPQVKAKAEAEGTKYDMLGFEFIPPVDNEGNIDNRGVLYIDTERSRNQFKRGFERIVRRAKVEKDIAGRIPKLKCVSLFGCMDPMEARKIIKEYLDTGEYCMVLLDGSSDFVSDENDLKESKNFVRWLINISAKYEIGYVTTIHPNPNDQEGKGTGHLGTLLAKKLEAIVNMFFHDNGNENERVITSKTAQGGTRNDDSQINVAIYYSTQEWMFLSSEEKIEFEEPWMSKLRAKKFMLEYDFERMYDDYINKGLPASKRKPLSSTRKSIKELHERGVIHIQSGKVMLPDDTQTIKAVEEFQEEIPLKVGHGFDPDDFKENPDEYRPNYFPTTSENQEEEPF